jgi:peptidoglycan/LPS O-acetylase OafA/YrhL
MLHAMLTSAHPITVEYVNSGIRVIAICGMTIVVAYGSYNLIEAPARRWIRTLGAAIG